VGCQKIVLSTVGQLIEPGQGVRNVVHEHKDEFSVRLDLMNYADITRVANATGYIPFRSTVGCSAPGQAGP
jgi:hypothetical protein